MHKPLYPNDKLLVDRLNRNIAIYNDIYGCMTYEDNGCGCGYDHDTIEIIKEVILEDLSNLNLGSLILYNNSYYNCVGVSFDTIFIRNLGIISCGLIPLLMYFLA